jgi:preprotein translocase subunit SecG
METFLLIVHVLIAFVLIGLILLQQGKGADVGAAFGSGASSTIFGARGSASFLTRTTAILAVLFFSNSFFLAYLSANTAQQKSLMERVQSTKGQEPGRGERGVEKAERERKEATSDLPELPAGEKAKSDLPKSDLPSLPHKKLPEKQ